MYYFGIYIYISYLPLHYAKSFTEIPYFSRSFAVICIQFSMLGGPDTTGCKSRFCGDSWIGRIVSMTNKCDYAKEFSFYTFHTVQLYLVFALLVVCVGFPDLFLKRPKVKDNWAVWNIQTL